MNNHRMTPEAAAQFGDGIQMVAEKFMVMREECLEGQFDSIKKLRETNVPSVSYSRHPNSDDEEDSDEDDAIIENNMSAMEVDAPQPQRQLDHNLTDIVADESSTKDTPQVVDGWTVVSKKSKGRKK
ncbi:uncharacterized protein LOC121789331 [Salvia splendens]|uniref:uncharacterized protein LOC121789331 n=1 Tax=Salvia splendens TaxID=180675 RepID=UPI001C26012F|nr:uncharacterized protein LOC121789331 [Salvia splendens]